jgi:translation initiation factor 2B subunit (eIF-2B alpha/beta/delta family)
MRLSQTAYYILVVNFFMKETIESRLTELKNDRTHGAGWLSLYALNILLFAVEHSRLTNSTDFMNEMRGIFFNLAESRPGIVSIANINFQLIDYLSKSAYKEKTVKQLKSMALEKGNELLMQSEEATRKAAQNITAEITPGDIIITCSYSSLFCESIRLSKERGKALSVIVLKSLNNGIAYGERTADELKKYGVYTSIIDDEDIDKNISGVSKAITGADTIASYGSFINGTPTLKLAESVRKNKLPFLVICETHKFDAYGFAKKNTELEKGFDRIPLNLITRIITELGPVKPSQLQIYMELLKAS